MNKTLFKRSIQANLVIWLIFVLVLMMYFSIIVTMYSPESQKTMMDLLNSLPPALMNAFGFTAMETTLVGYIGNYYFGFIVLLFPMIFYIIVNYRLVVKHVESGSMAYLLSSDTKRSKIIVTQGAVSLLMTGSLVLIVYLAGIGLSQLMFPNQLDIPMFSYLCLGLLGLHFMLNSISFVASCLFNEGCKALALGAGVPIACFLLQMLANIGDKFEFLKYFSLFTLFEPNTILSDKSTLWIPWIVMMLITFVLYTGALIGFKKRDLPL